MLGVVLLAGAAVTGVLWVIGTEAGTAWLVRRLISDAPGFSIAIIRGSLLEGVSLQGVRLLTPRDELDIDSLTLAWNGSALLTGSLAFDRADASRAAYRRLAGGTAGGGGPPDLPWPVRLEQASLATLTVTIGQQTVLLKDTRFAATYGNRRLELETLVTTWEDAAIAADATFELRAAIEAEISGEWSAPIAGVPANGRMTLAGTWPTLRVTHELAAPFAASTSGTAVVGSPLTVDVATQWRDLAWPGVEGIASSEGRLTLAGSFGAYRYDGSGAVEAAGRNATFAVEGTGAALELAIAQLVLTPAPPQDGGTLAAAGSVSLAEPHGGPRADGERPRSGMVRRRLAGPAHGQRRSCASPWIRSRTARSRRSTSSASYAATASRWAAPPL